MAGPGGPRSGRIAALRSESIALYGTARFLILVRVLLLAVGLGILMLGMERRAGADTSRALLGWLLVGSAVFSAVVAAAVHWFDRTWKLVLPLIIDVLWVGLFCYGSGGVLSPAVPMLFAVSLTALLVVPGFLPFVFPSLTSLVLAGSAVAYLAGLSPYSETYLAQHDGLVEPVRIISSLVVQIAGLYMVDALGQVLTRRLREQRVLTDEVLDQLGEGVVVLGHEGLVTYANHEARRLLDIDVQPVGKSIDSFLQSKELADVRELVARRDLPVLERFMAPHGRSLVLRVNVLTDRKGRESGRILLVADETRLVVLEESARRAERLAALGEMAAGIAHEIRNPLTGLRGCAQEVAEIVGEQGNRDVVDLTKVIISEADRLSRIVEDVLTLSRLHPGERQACPAETLFADIERIVSHQPGPAVVFTVEDGCGAIHADQEQMRQILLNLIANARDAVRDRSAPRITVHACVDDADLLGVPAVRIEVADNGCGIPEGHAERIFTPFFTTKARGTGLGLSVVQRIVREHEGAMRVESRTDHGTTIIVALPSHSQTRTFRRALGGS